MATPPVTPPLSVASYHGSTTSVSSSNNNMSNSIDTHTDSNNIGRSSRRKRPRRKSLAGHDDSVGSSSNDNVAAGSGERPYGDAAPFFSSSLTAPSYSCGDDGSDGDSGEDYYGSGGGKGPALLRPPFPSTSTKKSPQEGRRRRRRLRCCCCRLSSRCLLMVGLCLMTAYLTFKVVWYFQWQARCVEGCYDPSMAKTGSRGPEQVRERRSCM